MGICTHLFSIFSEAVEHFYLAAQHVAAVVTIYSGAERLSIFRTICSRIVRLCTTPFE